MQRVEKKAGGWTRLVALTLFDLMMVTRPDLFRECPKKKRGINVKGQDKRGAWMSGGYLQATNQLVSEDFISNLVSEGSLNSVSNEFANFFGLFSLAVGHRYRSVRRRKKNSDEDVGR